jgi:hypothetical protein
MLWGTRYTNLETSRQFYMKIYVDSKTCNHPQVIETLSESTAFLNQKCTKVHGTSGQLL